MPEPTEILRIAFQRVADYPHNPIIKEDKIRENIGYIVECLSNRSAVRVLISCCLAKVHNSTFDIRKPYTEIGDSDCFSGRTYDEQYITAFIHKNNLPCNNTTAFLTPAWRNRNETLTRNLRIAGKPPLLYAKILELLDAVYTNHISAEDILAETIRLLILLRNERQNRINALTEALSKTKEGMPLSSESIIKLIEQHISLPHTSRLPVLLITAAYRAAQSLLQEKVLDLQSHNAVDTKTGALGDVEITLINDAQVITVYEMKDKKITREDIEIALQKIVSINNTLDNYIFITTKEIDLEVKNYALSLYEETGGIEFALLDCIGFVRHYLHLFHRLRSNFLEEYQSLILSEPESSVSQPVKEAFLSMRQAMETD